MKSALVLIFALIFEINCTADEINGAYQYTTPRPFDFITTAPENYGDFLEESFQRESLRGWGLIAFSTGALYLYDQKIFSETQRFGKRLGFGNTDKSRESLFIGHDGLLYAPTDLPSSILFLGDGWTSIGLSAGLLTSGLINNSPKEKVVASEILQGLLFSGVTTQVLKRISGREIPNARTKDRGRFKPLAGPSEFHDNKAHFDSFPSAHMTTAMTTFTIISENYEDIAWINPVGYTLLSLLGFQLINSGSHWASDFPLALGVGYASGKTIAKDGRRSATAKSESSLLPLWSPEGIFGAQFQVNF